MLYALYSNSQLIYPVFGVTDEQGQAVIFSRSILYALCNMLLKYCFWYRKFLWIVSGLFPLILWYKGWK